MLVRGLGDFLDLLYPPVCGLCGRPADSEDSLVCNRCWEFIQGMEAPYCSGCRQLLFESLSCPKCRPAPMVIFSLGYYDGQLQTIIRDLKFQFLKPLAAGLGRRMADMMIPFIDKIKPDMVIPVPLHASRRYSRGFNQAEEIAREIAGRFDIPLMTEVLFTVRKTKQQAKLPAALREFNVRGAFAVADDERVLEGKRIILVDDVTTTGATLQENARVLHAAGVKKITGAVAATAL